MPLSVLSDVAVHVTMAFITVATVALIVVVSGSVVWHLAYDCGRRDGIQEQAQRQAAEASE